MTKFNQSEFESKAKKLVVKYLNYEINEKEVFIVWFSKIGKNAKAMLSNDLDWHYFEITYLGEKGKYIVDVYDITEGDEFNEEELRDASTSHVQIGVDKVTASVETKCPICQEHHQILGLTDAFELRIKEDILILTVRALYSDKRSWKDAFKIKYCPFCGRPLNEEGSNGKSIDKSPTSGD